MVETYAVYCPTCSVRLGLEAPWAKAHADAQVHASITGHVVNLVDPESWRVTETVAGSPSLPLWDEDPNEPPAPTSR